MSDTNRSFEDLLFATIDAVSRFRMGRLESASAAIDAGSLLTEAKRRHAHSEWGDWLVRVGLAPRIATRWMRLASLGITAEDVIARGGIRATLNPPKSATVTDLPVESDAPDVSDLQRELAEAEAAIKGAKDGCYDALNRRQRVLRALARANRGNCFGWVELHAFTPLPPSPSCVAGAVAAAPLSLGRFGLGRVQLALTAIVARYGLPDVGAAIVRCTLRLARLHVGPPLDALGVDLVVADPTQAVETVRRFPGLFRPLSLAALLPLDLMVPPTVVPEEAVDGVVVGADDRPSLIRELHQGRHLLTAGLATLVHAHVLVPAPAAVHPQSDLHRLSWTIFVTDSAVESVGGCWHGAMSSFA